MQIIELDNYKLLANLFINTYYDNNLPITRMYYYLLPENQTKLIDNLKQIELSINNMYKYKDIYNIDIPLVCIYSKDSYKYTILVYITGNFENFKMLESLNDTTYKTEISNILETCLDNRKYLQIKQY
jgi:hypothetical protein